MDAAEARADAKLAQAQRECANLGGTLAEYPRTPSGGEGVCGVDGTTHIYTIFQAFYCERAVPDVEAHVVGCGDTVWHVGHTLHRYGTCQEAVEGVEEFVTEMATINEVECGTFGGTMVWEFQGAPNLGQCSGSQTHPEYELSAKGKCYCKPLHPLTKQMNDYVEPKFTVVEDASIDDLFGSGPVWGPGTSPELDEDVVFGSWTSGALWE